MIRPRMPLHALSWRGRTGTAARFTATLASLKELVRRTALTVQPGGWVKAHTCSDRYDIHAKMEDRACEWVAGMRRYMTLPAMRY